MSLKKIKPTELFESVLFCGNCIYFKTEGCILTPEYHGVPCGDGVLLYSHGKNMTLIRVFALDDIKYKTISKTKLTTKSFKAKMREDFLLKPDEVEELIILVNKKLAFPKEIEEYIEKKEEIVDPEIEKKAIELLKSANIIELFIKDSNRMVVMDEQIRKLVLFTLIGALGDKPHNLAMIGPWSIGKTHITVCVSSYFDGVWSMGYMSPKALIHLKGEYDEDREAHIIDMRFKTLIFLDRPHQETLEVLKPLLSRDKYEIEYKFVEKKSGETWTSILRGYPVCILCAVDSRYTEEYTSRWITASPESSKKKIGAVILQKGSRAAHPEKYAAGEDYEFLRAAFTILRRVAPYSVVIPYGEKLSMHFRADKLVDQRFFDMFMALIKAVTILRSFQRRRDDKGRLIAELDDYEDARKVFTTFELATVYGVGMDVIEFYEKVLSTEEWYNVLSYEKIMGNYEAVYGEPLGRDRMMKSYIVPLERIGLIDIRPDPSNGRRKQIIPLKMKRQSLIDHESFMKSILQELR